jgi:hypothetical protein
MRSSGLNNGLPSLWARHFDHLLIAAASGEPDEINPKLVGSERQRRIFVAL